VKFFSVSGCSGLRIVCVSWLKSDIFLDFLKEFCVFEGMLCLEQICGYFVRKFKVLRVFMQLLAPFFADYILLDRPKCQGFL